MADQPPNVVAPRGLDAFLKEWSSVLAELGALLDDALDVEPVGGCPEAWVRWLSRYEVMALGEDARLAEVLRGGQTKGAPLSEVAACLEGLSREAAARLAPFKAQLTPEQARSVDEGLHTLKAQALEQFRVKATVKKKRMFGAAKELANKHQYGAFSSASAWVMTCERCGAPRLTEALD